MMLRYPVGFAVALLLSACGAEDHGDLRGWMHEVEKDMRGNIAPLPKVKPYEPVAYDAASVVDPFSALRAKADAASKGGLLPDMSRAKDPLEEFPLETLNFVGFLQDKKRLVAQILANGKSYEVRVGQHMGQNFGRVVKIDTTKDEEKVVLKELVQEADGNWVDRESVLYLGGKGGKS